MDGDPTTNEERGKIMFQGLFNYDNPVWRFIGKLGDLILLNLLWVVCSIPIITIGASTTAVYYVTLKLVRDEDDSTIRSFFHSFKSNFKQATLIWILLMAVGAVLGFDLWFFQSGLMPFDGIPAAFFTAASGGLMFLYLFIVLYVFPIQARFYNPVKRTLFNAFFMSVRHLFQTLGLLITDAAVVVGTYFGMFYVPQLGMLLFLFGFPLIAFINSYFFHVIFKRYTPQGGGNTSCGRRGRSYERGDPQPEGKIEGGPLAGQDPSLDF